MNKKFMIRCDIEGVSGVVSYEQAEPGKPGYEFGRKMFMSDLMATVNGLNSGGAGEIHIYDEHFYGRNIDLDILPENVVVYCGKPPYRADWAGGLDKSFTGLILIGFHSMRGTGELLNHTYEPDIKKIRINNIHVGEIGVEAAIAGDFNVPLLMVTADSAGVEEARLLVPKVKFVVVKESLGETKGMCYPVETTQKKIYGVAKDIAKETFVIDAFSLKGDVKLEVELFTGSFKESFEKLFGKYIEDGTIIINKPTVTAAWAKYWEMKIKCSEQ